MRVIRTANRIQSKVLKVIIPQVQRSHFRGPTVQPPHIRVRRLAWSLAWSPGANLNAIAITAALQAVQQRGSLTTQAAHPLPTFPRVFSAALHPSIFGQPPSAARAQVQYSTVQ